MDPTLYERMEEYQQRGEQLQREAKYKQALNVYEQLLTICRNAYGQSSSEFQRTSIKICELCNLIAMILLQKERYQLCLIFLKKAEAHCIHDSKYTAITFNNYACYCRKTGKLRTALMHLQNALELEWRSKKEDTLADTYLNLCAVLSQLGKHKEALQNVLYSITILQEEIFLTEKVSPERTPVLTIAYHNMGVELEHLERYEESISTYEKGLRFAEKYLPQDSGLIQKLKNALENASENKKQKNNGMQMRPVQSVQKPKIQKMKSLYKERPFTAYKK